MIRPCIDADFDAICAVINDGAQAYRGVMPIGDTGLFCIRGGGPYSALLLDRTDRFNRRRMRNDDTALLIVRPGGTTALPVANTSEGAG